MTGQGRCNIKLEIHEISIATARDMDKCVLTGHQLAKLAIKRRYQRGVTQGKRISEGCVPSKEGNDTKPELGNGRHEWAN